VCFAKHSLGRKQIGPAGPAQRPAQSQLFCYFYFLGSGPAQPVQAGPPVTGPRVTRLQKGACVKHFTHALHSKSVIKIVSMRRKAHLV
jgi:hypothetical protein